MGKGNHVELARALLAQGECGPNGWISYTFKLCQDKGPQNRTPNQTLYIASAGLFNNSKNNDILQHVWQCLFFQSKSRISGQFIFWELTPQEIFIDDETYSILLRILSGHCA